MSTLYSRSLISIVAALAILLWVASHGLYESTDMAHDNDTVSSRNAFATILTSTPGNESEIPNFEEPYLRAARLLTFQLLLNPHTRNRNGIPLLILVAPDVLQRHRNILIREGATVVPLESHEFDWGSQPQRWDSLLAKLNLWKLERYHKVAFLDVETILLHPLDDIFEDSATTIRNTAYPTANTPKNYMMAAPYESLVNLDTQVLLNQNSYKERHMSTGFLVLHPSQSHYNYYKGLFHIFDKNDSGNPEEALFNYAHRADGPMPWQIIGRGWNSKEATQFDCEQGLKSITHHWRRPINDSFVGDLISSSLDKMAAYLNH